jgi:Uma2 family endonuclease
MGTVAGRLITFEEFLELPAPEFGHYEFREGEVILVPPPKPAHHETRDRLGVTLKAVAPPHYRVLFEFAYQIRRKRFIVADLGITTQQRWQAALDSGEYFDGAPEFVLEVLSPANTAAEIGDKRSVSLSNGCVEYWTVDPVRRMIEVIYRGGLRAFGPGEQLPVETLGGIRIAADRIFPG